MASVWSGKAITPYGLLLCDAPKGRDEPSDVGVCADYLIPCPVTRDAAGLVIEIEASSMIGRRPPPLDWT